MARGRLTITPIAEESLIDDLSVRFLFHVADEAFDDPTAGRQASNSEFARDLGGLFVSPDVRMAFRVSFHFDHNWTRQPGGTIEIKPSPRTKDQVMALFRTGQAIERVRQALGAPDISVAAELYHYYTPSTALDITAALVFKLRVPAGVSVFDANVLFYKYAFEELTHWQNDPAASVCLASLGTPAHKMAAPANLPVKPSSRVPIVGYRGLVTTLRTPLGPVEFELHLVKQSR